MPNVPTFSRFQTGNRAIDQAQDQARDVFNAQAKATQPKVQVVQAAPTATAQNVGHIIHVKTPGSTTVIQMCAQTSKNTYQWVTIGTST